MLCLTPIITKGEIVDYTEERSTEFEVVTEDFTLPVYCSGTMFKPGLNKSL